MKYLAVQCTVSTLNFKLESVELSFKNDSSDKFHAKAAPEKLPHLFSLEKREVPSLR
jgi:hypothetical protein